MFDYFRLLTTTGTGIYARFGGQGSETPISGAGLGIKLNNKVKEVTLYNSAAVSRTITIAYGNGFISDDRLNLQGIVYTRDYNQSLFNTQQPIVNTTATAIMVSDSNRISYRIDSGATDLYLGRDNTVLTTTGFLLRAQNSLLITSTQALWGIRPSVAGSAYIMAEYYV